MTEKVESDFFIPRQMDVEKDDDCNQEEAVCSLEVAGHVIDLQKTNVEDCRYRSESYEEQSDHRRDVSNPFQCFHSSKIYNSNLDMCFSNTRCLLLCHLIQNLDHSSFKPL